MKRKLLIEIDCEDLHCGNCEYLFSDVSGCFVFANHELEYDELGGMYLRLDVCLNTEVNNEKPKKK